MSQGAVDTRLEVALDILRDARPFIELEASLENSGMGKPGRGDAPDILRRIDEALAEGWPEPAALPEDYWETAQ